ncbi:MAG: TonB-dependent receptor domain-containing protein [Bacteroidales bacterium]
MTYSRTLLSFILSLIVIPILAQNPSQSIKAIVIDEHNKPLEFATVLLRDTTGSKLIQGSNTDEQGQFTISAKRGLYLIEVGFVGYNTAKHRVRVAANAVQGLPDTIKLTSQDNQLDAVTVVGKKQIIERKIDMLVMNIESMAAAETYTGVELLRRAPGVAIDDEGNITLNGNAVQVWIDGRPSNLSGQELVALLEGTEGSTIDKIEIIANPSSRYDAAGSGGIINIKTKRHFAMGLNGNARLGYRQFLYNDFLYGINGSLALNYRAEKLSVVTNYSVRNRLGRGENTERLYTADTLRRTVDSEHDAHSINHSAKLGIEYFADKKNTFGIVGNINARQMRDKSTTQAMIYNAPLVDDESSSVGTSNRNNMYGSLNLNYTHVFDDEQQDLNLNLDYMRNRSASNQSQSTEYLINVLQNQDLLNTIDQNVNVYGFRADYAQPINDKMKFEAGGKTSLSGTDNHNFEGYIYPDSSQERNNSFSFYEYITALYLNYSWAIDTVWSVKAGVRYENTHTKGDWKTANATTTRNYNDLFPSLYLSFNPLKNHNFGLSYNRRINRPSYWHLNPYRNVANPYLYTEGNPNLTPAYSNIVKFEYSLFRFINLALSYSNTKDMMVQVAKTLPNNITLFTQENFGTSQHISFNTYFSQVPIAKWWTVNINLWAAYIANDNYTYTNSTYTANAWMSNNFKLTNSLKLDIDAWINSPSVWGYFETKTRGAVDISLKKSFWDNNASLSFYIRDLFNTNYFGSDMREGDTKREVRRTWESRQLGFSFSYKFGKASQTLRQRKIIRLDENSRLGGGAETGGE